jgi:hypothetical protein
LLCLLLQKIHFLVAVMALKKTRILISKVNIKFYRCTMEWDQPTGHQHHTSDWNVLIVGNWVDYATEISAAINQEYTTVFNFFWLVAIRPWNSIQLDVCKTMKRKIVNFWMSYIHSLVGRLPTDQRQDICSSSNQQVPSTFLTTVNCLATHGRRWNGDQYARVVSRCWSITWDSYKIKEDWIEITLTKTRMTRSNWNTLAVRRRSTPRSVF